MVNKKETEEPQAFIDYDGDSSNEAPKRFSHRQLEDYWKKLIMKHHGASCKPWYIKEKTLLSRLLIQFKSEQIAEMMEHWISKSSLEHADSFGYFFNRRNIVYENTFKDYSWD